MNPLLRHALQKTTGTLERLQSRLEAAVATPTARTLEDAYLSLHEFEASCGGLAPLLQDQLVVLEQFVDDEAARAGAGA